MRHRSKSLAENNQLLITQNLALNDELRNIDSDDRTLQNNFKNERAARQTEVAKLQADLQEMKAERDLLLRLLRNEIAKREDNLVHTSKVRSPTRPVLGISNRQDIFESCKPIAIMCLSLHLTETVKPSEF